MLKLERGRDIALVSTPWPLFNRPSIQLGALKAFLLRELPVLSIHTYPLYLSIAEELGYDLYERISERNWPSESVYAALLYPEKSDSIERFWWQRPSGRSLLAGTGNFQKLCRRVKSATDRFLEEVDWRRYILAGFSICFGQLTSSLYLIHRLKKAFPGLKIVAGGSSCASDMGASLLRTFPAIDFVIQGEGERPLVNLVKGLLQSTDTGCQHAFPGILNRRETREGPASPEQITDLDELPIPEYDDYFRLLASFPLEKRFFPKIPVEISRGCWWRKRSSRGRHAGCAFCNLNLQWEGYRSKSRPRILSELEKLSDRHQALSFSFADNLLPAGDLENIFDHIKELGKQFRLFGEIRAVTSNRILGAMGVAGTEVVQVGVESLSTALLKKLNKGTTAMDNLQIMRDCETPGLPNLNGNLILEFPSSDERDVAETLANLKFAWSFHPLKPIPFWLGYESPVFCDPHAYGIRVTGNHRHYGRLFPPDIVRGLKLMTQGYQGQVRYQRRLWKRVREEAEKWRKRYEALRRAPGEGPILSYLDGRTFMLIRERRSDREVISHRLTGTSRKIYLFCQTNRSLHEILSRFPGLQEDRLLPFLHMMAARRLMFNEGSRYLSLAVPTHRIPG